MPTLARQLLWLACLSGAVLGLAVAPAGAQDAAQPAPFGDDEIKAAEAVRQALSDEDRALYNGLRYLLRPDYEEELFKGRRRRPCPLPGMEEKSPAPMQPAEHLRLWAVLQSGLARGQALENQIERLLSGPRPRGGLNLGAIALELGALRAVALRKDARHEAVIKARAAELYQQSRQLASHTGTRSPWYQQQAILPQWYGAHLWRALIARYGHDLGVDVKAADWDDDLRVLLNAWNKESGWSTWRQKMQSPQYDLHPNLMALCALQLAAGAPEKLVSKGVAADIRRRLNDSGPLMNRLAKDYGESEFTESRLLLVFALAGLAPAGTDAAAWHARLRRQGLAFAEPSGAFPGRSTLQVDLALAYAGFKRGERAAVETSLVLLALTGGLMAEGNGPLAGQSLTGVGRTLYALSVCHAASAREQARDFAGRVNAAIADGCDYIVRSQLSDGSFPGIYRASIGNHGACVLTLLHGGYDRKHPAVVKGLDYIVSSRQPQSGTYANAIVLMALQKFYEREQREHGLLGCETPQQFEAARARVFNALSEPHRKLATELLAELEGARASGNGGYTYYGTAGRTTSGQGASYYDNSCSQYAMLGFKAASMLGLRVNSSVFSDEAARLIRQYQPAMDATALDFEYAPDARDGDEKERKTKSRATPRTGKITPGGWGYSGEYRGAQTLQMTAAGVSSLTICMDELKIRGRLGHDLAFRIALHIHGAQYYMAGSYYKPEHFEANGRSILDHHSDGWGGYYNLYSVERACLLAGIRTLGQDVDWYRIGAEGLLDAQYEDGSWDGAGSLPGAENRVAMINTCMAILFLKQAAMPVITEHKKREKERAERDNQPQTPRSPITPGPEDKKKPAPEPEPEPEDK
ncbi:MAG: hypothetical protein HS108_05125 [Planctomycetes bacterium]|nr:hypothetical protein [Planctomycetota bacterium]MCL4730921.1 hypothetical protein [Planctomycetota bacterium]